MDSRALNMQHRAQYDFNIVSLNIRSLKKHYADLISDPIIPHADVVCLQETWLEENENVNSYQIPGFHSSFNSVKRGRGVATFYKQNNQIEDVKHRNFQISKIVTEHCDPSTDLKWRKMKFFSIFQNLLILINQL